MSKKINKKVEEAIKVEEIKEDVAENVFQTVNEDVKSDVKSDQVDEKTTDNKVSEDELVEVSFADFVRVKTREGVKRTGAFIKENKWKIIGAAALTTAGVVAYKGLKSNVVDAEFVESDNLIDAPADVETFDDYVIDYDVDDTLTEETVDSEE